MEISEELLKVLKDSARFAMAKAHSPYSKVNVGAIVLCEDGMSYSGCNVENASFGLTICAERVAISKAISEGSKKLTAVIIVSEPKGFPPCGACRQFINEFAESDCKIYYGDKETTISELLPDSFDELK